MTSMKKENAEARNRHEQNWRVVLGLFIYPLKYIMCMFLLCARLAATLEGRQGSCLHQALG